MAEQVDINNTSANIRVPVGWKDFLAGYISGVANICVGQPFDICKVRIQRQGHGSFTTMFMGIVKNEGVLSLWKGSTFPLITFGVCNAILFAVNDQSKYMFKKLMDVKDLSVPFLFLSGGFAGLANTFVSCPMEHIRIRMQIQDSGFKLYKNSIDAAVQIYKAHGFVGLNKGFGVSFVREFFLYGSYFAAYEFCRQYNPSTNPLWMMTCGGIGGMAGWIGGCLIDNVKSKIQGDSLTDPKYKNARTLFRQLSYRELSKGFTVGLYRSYPVNVVTFCTYELSCMMLYGDKY